MVSWFLQNLALYVGVVALTCVSPRTLPIVPRLTTAAWLVVTLKYLPWIYGMSREIVRGACGFRCATSWPALSPWITVLTVPTAAAYLWRGREDVASLLVLLVAANWVLLEVIGLHLTCVDMRFWFCAVPLLGLVTLLTLGPYAVWNAIHVQSGGA